MVPYPGANAGKDTVICYNSSAQLHGIITGSSFSWSPAGSLNNPNILNPIATPPGTTSYVLSVTDVLGCPKPKRDTIVVTVLPKVNAFAGKDTAVVVGQPLHFNATGGVSYLWSPATALNNTGIHNPTGLYDGSFDSIRYKVVVRDQANCADSAFVTIKVFRTNPQIFVPTAFTPNGDGKNDLFRPIPVGISRFDYFRVYNRWGQLVYSSTNLELGWDGKIQGRDQGSNTYVWMVKGVDFTGKEVFAKGTVTLIR
jgi:gliding motility-associated-like protein